MSSEHDLFCDCVVQSWNDTRLTWVPANYDSIDETHVYQDFVWTPPIIVYNS